MGFIVTGLESYRIVYRPPLLESETARLGLPDEIPPERDLRPEVAPKPIDPAELREPGPG